LNSIFRYALAAGILFSAAAVAAETRPAASGSHAEIQIFSPAMPTEKNPDYYDAMAAQSADREDWEAASHVYDEALQAFPRHARLRHNAAALRDAWSRAAMARRDWDNALSACENAVERSLMPDHFQKQIAFVLQEAGRDYLQAGDVTRLEVWLARAQERFPSNPNLKPLAFALYAQGLEDLPLRDDRFYVAQGLRLLRSHQDLLGMAHPDTQLVNTWCGRLLQVLWDRKEWAACLSLLQTARELLPHDKRLRLQEVALWDSQAREYIESRQWDMALMVYDQALERFPQEKCFVKNRKYCQQKKDHPDRSLQ